MQGSSDYYSPISDRGNYLVFNKTFSRDKVEFCIVAVANGSFITNVTGIYFKLDDGTILKNETEKASPRVNTLSSYFYYAQYNLTDDDIQLLLKHKIVKFGVGDFQVDIKEKDQTHNQNYLECLNNIKS